MKSIFKKIALVLALAMVVTMLPAKSAAVSAADASANKWVRKTCTLYVDAPVTGDEDGIYFSSVYATKKAAVGKMDEDGWGTLGYSVSFKSENENVATVGPRYGLIEAVGIGTTTITATFSKEGEDDIVESFPVTVKRAATDVALDEESAKAVQELVVGADPVELKAVMTDAAGNVEVVEKTADNGGKLSDLLSEGRQFVTDYLKYDVKNPEGKTVLEVEGNKLSAVAEGEATLLVKAYRYDWQTWGKTKSRYVKVVTAQAEITVTVKAAGLVDGSASQTSLNTFKVNASSAETAKAVADTFNNKKVDDALYPAVDKKISDSLTIKNIAIEKVSVENDVVLVFQMYDNLDEKTEYTVRSNGTSAEFASVEYKPVSIEIDPLTVKKGFETNDGGTINAVIKTAEGVDITSKYSYGSDITIAVADGYTFNDGYFDSDPSSRKLYIYEAGKQARLTATLEMGWDNEKNVKIENLTVTRDITGVDEVSANNAIEGFAVLSSTEHKNNAWKANKDNVKNLPFGQGTIRLAVGDVYYLYAKYSVMNGTKREDAYLSDDNKDGFTLTSSNENVLSVNENQLYPQTTGSASVTVKLGNQIIGVAYVNVVAERYLDPQSVKVEISKRNLSTADGDSITVTVTAKDQLGEDITPTVKIVNRSDNKSPLFNVVESGNKVTLSNANIETGKSATVSMVLEITAGNNTNIKRQYPFGITVKGIAESTELKEATNYNVSVSNGELDVKLGKDKQTTEIKLEGLKDGFHLYTYDSSMFKAVENQNGIEKTTDGKLKKGVYVQVTNGSFNAKNYIKNGSFYSLIASGDNGINNTTVSGGAITVSGSAIRANTGTYVVRVYVVPEDGATPRIVTTSFTVKDSTSIAAEVKKSTVNGNVAQDSVSALIGSVNLKIDGWKEITSGEVHDDGIMYTITGCKLANTSSVNSYFVTSIIVTASKDGMATMYEVPVNRLFRKE